jgi:DNA-binding transcriptional ArsR family regulator
VTVAAVRADASVSLGGPGVATRICVQVDPMITVLTSLVEAFGPLSRRVSADLRTSMARAARGTPMSLLRLMTFDGRPHTFDFVASVDATDASSFRERLEQVRATPLEDLDEELVSYDVVDPATLRRWRDNTDRVMADYCSGLRAYWNDVVQPHYPKLEQRLRREAGRMEMALAHYGHSTVLNLLHPKLRLRDDRLILRDSYYTGPRSWTPDRLIIKPMMAAPATYFSNIGTTWVHGASVVQFCTSPPALRPGWPVRAAGFDRSDSLALLIGRSRARILESLRRRPGTTTDLADEFGLTPGTVSHHLGVLEAADVIRPLRRGSSVFYLLNDRGIALATL